ncbi:MAG TPA: ATP-binding cassette domain-containing protein [Gammaproteobacteria bacterium]|nr:ATP-binding cassette domain-containing protein [Gammaproteobacteria bacterium]
MNREILIAVNHLVRYYGEYCAVNDVSFTINRGEVLGFLGPNGAGKSTTMKIISGVLPPHAGSVAIAGIDMLAQPRAAKQHIGFLPEQPPLYGDLTVDEYLRYAARLRGISKAGLPSALESSKKRCGLEDTGHRLIRNLSKGYQQRVGIAQAIIHSPQVVILDEPTIGLDPIQIREIRDLIKELGEDHSVILSTHILPEVQTVCNRVLIINEGKLVMDRQLDSLGTEKQAGSLCVTFKNPPSVETLQGISGVSQVEAMADNRFRLQFQDADKVIDTLLQRALSSCWGLQELTPQADSLEEIFMQLTSGSLSDPASHDAEISA